MSDQQLSIYAGETTAPIKLTCLPGTCAKFLHCVYSTERAEAKERGHEKELPDQGIPRLTVVQRSGVTHIKCDAYKTGEWMEDSDR